ncbi:haloacid dehalogenase type II [Galbibacter mesophilus]|uniref:haloacid dehalogenase type II n=1 Tax=Galbibacter mesophilus TaxID=379069 RepID=UPI00191F465C|nr:haloacid dehalogenase type II [Galbibacter mesophilus]MCM5661458.1 haloacid dehalogenase type II [Galbibacter mesophilus]
MIRAVFFDMNETLLNLNLLDKEFKKYFEDPFVLKYWFAKLLHSSTVLGIMDTYHNFGELAGAALENVFYENDKKLTKETKQEILSAFKKLPAYTDVKSALQHLKNENIKLFAVSNSSKEMMQEQLSNAEILHLFDGFYSVDSVEKYKPFKDIYLSVAEKQDLKTSELIMVASHDWDLFGAKKAGLKTAYIQRKKEIYNPFYPKSDFNVTNLVHLAEQIIKAS